MSVIAIFPTSKDQCKNGGWHRFSFLYRFKNQGDCIQFVNTCARSVSVAFGDLTFAE
jgi:hypothetical protein